MKRWAFNQRMAAVLGLVGGVLGVLVGFVQMLFGPRIPDWTGNKTDSVQLGILTVALGLVSILAGWVLLDKTATTPARRLTAALGLLIPASLCFSTGGVLWVVPGAVLITAGVYAVLAGDMAQTRELVVKTWLHLMLSLLGGFEVLMAVSAGSTIVIAVGVIGGLALMFAPWFKNPLVSLGLLVIGTLPFAVMTWWAVASPLLAVVAMCIGVAVIRSTRRRPVVNV